MMSGNARQGSAYMQGFFKVAVVLALLFRTQFAFGYIFAKTEGGVNQKWLGTPYLPLAGYEANRSGLSGSTIYSIVSRALQKWQSASEGKIKFDYWQGTDPTVYEPNRNYNGLSSLYFLSQDEEGEGLDPQVIGMTQVWYDQGSGNILETDVILNDVNYQFTNNATDTLRYGTSRVYLDSVVTHELGHAFGLSHSGTFQSTMLYVESPEQAELGCDDQAAIKSLYADLGTRAGSIAGRVVSPSSRGVFGALVSAISIERSEILASVLTDKAGNFKIEGLEPTEYTIMVEPYSGSRGSLSPYYATMDPTVCSGGAAFRRSFVMSDAATGKTKVISLSSTRNKSIGNITVACGANSPFPRLGQVDSSESVAAYVTEAPLGQSTRIDWNFSKDHIEFGVLAFSLFSPVYSTLNSGLNTQTPLYEGASGFTNYDQKISDDVLSHSMSVQVNARSSLGGAYTGGMANAIESDPFTLFTLFSGNRRGKLYPQATRCKINQSSFTTYRSPSGDPVRKDPSVGFCTAATVSAEQKGLRPDSSRGSDIYRTHQIIGWWISMSLSVVGYFLLRCASWLRGLLRQTIAARRPNGLAAADVRA